MLVLTRRLGEKIVISDDIVLTMLSTKGKQIKVGITAPQKISVHRQEVYQKIKAQKKISVVA
jgi:carbon storage regulator